MKDSDKAEQQLIRELAEARKRIAELQDGRGEGPRAGEDGENVRDVMALARSAMQLAQLSPGDDVFLLIGERLLELAGDCFVVVTSFDEATSTFSVRQALGAGQPVDTLRKIVGGHPIGFSIPIDEAGRRGLTSGRLERVGGGLRELSAGGLSRSVCRAIEKALGVKEWHAMGFAWRGQLYGSAVVATRSAAELNSRQSVIEAFIGQASVALQRSHAEEALREANAELERRVEERTRDLAGTVARLEAEIAERARAEGKLERERAARDGIINLNPYSISVFDREGHFLSGNQAFMDLFGAPLPSDYSLFADPVLLGNGQSDELLRLKKGEVARIRELWYNPRFVSPDLPDRCRCVRGVVFPVMGGAGEVARIVAMHEDFTDRKRREEELHVKDGALAACINAIALADGEDRLHYVNPAFLRLWGYDDEREVLGRLTKEFWQQGEQVEQAAAAGNGEWRGEAIAVRRDGSAFVAEVSASVVSDRDGRPTSVIASFIDVTERQRLEQILRESEELSRGMLSAARAAVYIIQHGHFLYVNPQFEQITGRTMAELSGTHCLEHVHPDDRAMVKRRAVEQLKGLSDSPYEFRYIRSDGRSLHCLEKVASILYKGEPTTVGSFMDITALKEAQQELALSEERYRGLVETASAGVATVDAGGRLAFANQALGSMVGRTKEELEGTPFIDLVHPEDRPWVNGMLSNGSGTVKSGPVLEFRALHRDGHVVWCHTSLTYAAGETGPAGFDVIIHDVTERKQLEERFRSLIENASDVVEILDEDGIIQYASTALEAVLGHRPEEVVGQSAFGFAHPDDRAMISSQFASLVETPGAASHAEVRWRHSDGSWRHMAMVAQNRLDDPAVGGVVVNCRDITERKLAEEALRVSEERYRLLVENANEAIVVAQGGAFKYANAKAAELTGLSLGELEATPFMEVIHPDDRQMVAERHLRRLQGEEFEHVYSFRMVDRDGSIRWVQINAVLMTWEGKPATLNFLSEITEQKQAEEELRESESRYRLLAENVTDVIWTLDDKLKYTYLSPSVERLLGFTVEEARAMTFEERLTPASMEVVKRAIEEELLKTGPPFRTTWTLELEQYRKDGSTVWTELGMTLLRGADDEMLGILGITRDIAERKRAEDAQRQSEEQFRRFVQNDPDIIFRWSVDNGLEYVSPSASQITGYTPEELLADPVLGAEISKAWNLGTTPDVREAAAEGRALPPREFAFARRGGTEAYLEIRAAPVVDASGRLAAIEGALRDMTERRRAEEALKRSEEFSSSLLANSPNPILVVNPDTSIRYVNAALEELTGFSAAELIGTGPPYPWWTSDALEQTGRDLVDAIPRGANGLEQLYRKKDGEHFWVELTSIPVVEADGELKHYLATWVDVSERKRAEQALRHSEYRYRTALESARDGVLILDGDNMIVDANRASVSGIGYDYKEQLVGKSVFDVIAGESAQALRQRLREGLAKHGYLANFEVTARSRDGKLLPMEVSVSEMLDQAGKPAGSIAIVRDISERKRAEEQGLRYTRSLEGLHAISAAVSQTLDLEEVLGSALEKVLEVMGLESGYVLLLDSDKAELVLKAHRGLSDAYVAGLGTLKVTEEALKSWHEYPGPAFKVGRVLTRSSLAAAAAAGREEGVQANVFVPLWSKSVMHGGLTLLARKPRRFTAEEMELLKAIGNEIAVGIENAKLLERTKELSATDELTGLYNRRQFFEVLEGELNRMQRYGGSFTLAMLDLDEFKEYNDRFGHTNGDAVLRSVAQALRSGMRKPDIAFRYGGDEFAIILPETDAEKARGIIDRLRSTRLEGLQTELLASEPVLSFSAGIAQFPDNAETADGLVFLADTALYHSKRAGGNRSTLVSDLGELPADVVDRATMDQVYALAATVDARDPHTYGHSKRVATIAEMIGRAVDLRPRQLADLRAAALLHDIGKVGVPDSILTKPGKPEEQEWVIIRKHPVEGAKIVGYVKELERLVPLIRHHHEWYDGSGYPDGLKGEKIPLGARIISVADAYDTMVTSRPYRQMVSKEEARRELIRCAGTQFDARLVEALCEALEEEVAEMEGQGARQFMP